MEMLSIACGADEHAVNIKVKKIIVLNGVKLMLHRPVVCGAGKTAEQVDTDWTISDFGSGLYITCGETMKRAEEYAIELLSGHGINSQEKMDKFIEKRRAKIINN